MLVVIRNDYQRQRVRHLRKEIRKTRMETMRRWDDIDALIEHMIRVHEKM